MDKLSHVFTIGNRDGEIIEGAEANDLHLYPKDNKRVLFVKIVPESYCGCELPNGNEGSIVNDSVFVVIDVNLGMLGNVFGSSGYDHDHTGDRIGWKCQRISCGFFKDDIMEKPDQCPKCGAGSKIVEAKPSMLTSQNFPGEKTMTIDNVVDEVSGLFQESFSKKLVEDQPPAYVFGKFPDKIKVLNRVFSILPGGRRTKLMVALVPRGVVFRVIHSVTESGDVQAKYYKWDGEKFHSATDANWRSLFLQN